MRRSLVRFALLFGALAWVAGWGATLLHHVRTVHVVCEVHGDVVDVGHASASGDDRAVVTSLDAADQHDHDCGFLALGVARASAPGKVFAHFLTEHRQDDPAPAVRAPRGPPLVYAPKTSPPSV